MIKKNDDTFEPKIADEKQASIEVIVEKFKLSNDNQATKMLANVQPIIRKQRVTS